MTKLQLNTVANAVSPAFSCQWKSATTRDRPRSSVSSSLKPYHQEPPFRQTGYIVHRNNAERENPLGTPLAIHSLSENTLVVVFQLTSKHGADVCCPPKMYSISFFLLSLQIMQAVKASPGKKLLFHPILVCIWYDDQGPSHNIDSALQRHNLFGCTSE